MKQKEPTLMGGLRRKIQYFDWKLLIPYLLLVGTGIIMVYSSSSYFAMTTYNNSEYFVIRQIVFSVASLVMVGICSLLNNKLFQSKTILLCGIIGLLLILFGLIVRGWLTGDESAVNGANAWLNIGGFGLQPAEFLKVLVILYLAVFLSKNQEKLCYLGDFENLPTQKDGKIRGVLEQTIRILKKPLCIIGLFLVLVLLQPDMGGVIIIGSVCLVMFLLSGIPFKFGIWAIGLAGAGYGAIIGIFSLFDDIPLIPSYMADRFYAFIDPFHDVQNSSFQLVNSFYALARGGMFGVGLGESVQKSGYLPESYTDFIIPIMAEELGLVGVIVVLSIFFYLVYRIYRISLSVSSPFGQLVCIGIATLFLVQGSINVGGAVGLMPLTGVTFPFISYGGSSIIVSSLAIAIVNNIYVTDQLQKEKSAEREL